MVIKRKRSIVPFIGWGALTAMVLGAGVVGYNYLNRSSIETERLAETAPARERVEDVRSLIQINDFEGADSLNNIHVSDAHYDRAIGYRVEREIVEGARLYREQEVRDSVARVEALQRAVQDSITRAADAVRQREAQQRQREQEAILAADAADSTARAVAKGFSRDSAIAHIDSLFESYRVEPSMRAITRAADAELINGDEKNTYTERLSEINPLNMVSRIADLGQSLEGDSLSRVFIEHHSDHDQFQFVADKYLTSRISGLKNAITNGETYWDVLPKMNDLVDAINLMDSVDTGFRYSPNTARELPSLLRTYISQGIAEVTDSSSLRQGSLVLVSSSATEDVRDNWGQNMFQYINERNRNFPEGAFGIVVDGDSTSRAYQVMFDPTLPIGDWNARTDRDWRNNFGTNSLGRYLGTELTPVVGVKLPDQEMVTYNHQSNIIINFFRNN